MKSAPQQRFVRPLKFSYRFHRRGEQLQMFDGTLKNLLYEKTLTYKRLVSG